MPINTSKNSVEPVSASSQHQAEDQLEVAGAHKYAPLPWEAPSEFRNVPAHEGPLKNPKPVGFKATTDAEAIAVWLAERARNSENTAIAYRKEIERFLFWLADQDMTVSDASREDFIRYANFLQDPQPARRWISGKRYKRTDPKWKPFEKPLTSKTAQQSLSVVKAMISYLATNGWLTANTMPEPKTLVKHETLPRAEQIEARQIPEHLMEDLEDFIGRWTPAGQTLSNEHAESLRIAFLRARLQVIISLAGTLAARSSDLTSAFMTDIQARSENGKTRWTWYISKGKGSKDAALPVPEHIMEQIAVLRLCVGLTPHPKTGEPPCPLIPRAKELPKASDKVKPDRLKLMSRSGLYKHLTAVFEDFAVVLHSEGRKADAHLMQQASLHWLRHVAIKRIVSTTKNLTLAQKLARHSNVSTTGDYAKALISELADALEGIHANNRDRNTDR